MDKCEQCQGTGSIIANVSVYHGDGTIGTVDNPVVRCHVCGGAKVKGGWEARTREAEAGAHSWMDKCLTAEKALADVRVAVAVWRVEWHQEDCPAEDGGGCDPKMCGCDVQNDARTEARQLLGLEPKP